MYLSPAVALVSNVDPEHLDHHGTLEVLEQTFLSFLKKVPFYGFAVMCVDHPVVQELVPQVGRRVVTYGFAKQAMYRPANISNAGLDTTFTVFQDEEKLGEITLGMPGRHNVCNAMGALAVSMELGIPFSVIQGALDGFTGVQRRFTVRGEAAGVCVVDDYGHHPVEIEATLSAAEDSFPNRRVVAVFQPHRYSRVKDLYSDFCAAFNGAGHVVVCPIYAAGETPLEGIHHTTLAEDMRRRGHRGVVDVESLAHATDHLLQELRAGDVVVTLGAGNVNSICEALLQRLPV